MRRSILTVLFAAAAGVLAACQPTEPVKPAAAPNSSPAAPASSPAVPAASPAVSPSVDPKAPASAPSAKAAALEGMWPGVEGTSLNVTKSGEKYKVEIKNLDKMESFDGTAVGDTIQFTRKGKLETIKAATAEETGMKWLKGEKNCVVITKGSEGYCRK